MLATLNPIHDITPAVPQVSDGHFRHASNVSRVRHIEVLPFDTTGYRRRTGAWFLRSFGLSPACSSFPAAPSSSAPVAPPFMSILPCSSSWLRGGATSTSHLEPARGPAAATARLPCRARAHDLLLMAWAGTVFVGSFGACSDEQLARADESVVLLEAGQLTIRAS